MVWRLWSSGLVYFESWNVNSSVKPRLHCGVHVWRLPALGGGFWVAMKRQENRQ